MITVYIINYVIQYKAKFASNIDFLNDVESAFINDSTFINFIVIFLILHISVVVAILAEEVSHAENIGTGETITGIQGAASWLLANIVGTTSAITLKSPIALVAVGVLKTGYAFSSLGIGYGVYKRQEIMGDSMHAEKNTVAIFGRSHLYDKVIEELYAELYPILRTVLVPT